MNQIQHIQVKVSLARDRRREAEKELIHLAGPNAYGPGRQGTWSDLTWDFVRREDADLFMVNAQTVPGVLSAQMA